MGVSGFYVALIHPFCVDFGRIGLHWMLFAKKFLRQCYTLFLPCMLC